MDLDTPSGQIVGTLAVGDSPRQLVFSPDGSKLSGVYVRAVRTARDGEVWSDFCAITGDDGEFHFELPVGEGIEVIVDGRRMGLAPAGKPLSWLPVQGTVRVVAPQVKIVLRTEPVARDRELRVIVRGPDDRPLPGAEVVAIARGRLWIEQTGPVGTLRLAGLPDSPTNLGIRPGWIPDLDLEAVAPAAATVIPAGQTVTLTFRRGVPLAGWVVDEEANPVSGARVMVRTADGACGIADTDEKGRFRTTGLAGSKHTVQVTYFGDHDRRSLAYREGVIPEEGEVTLRLQWSR